MRPEMMVTCASTSSTSMPENATVLRRATAPPPSPQPFGESRRPAASPPERGARPDDGRGFEAFGPQVRPSSDLRGRRRHRAFVVHLGRRVLLCSIVSGRFRPAQPGGETIMYDNPRSLLDQITLMHGPHDLLRRYFPLADAAARDWGLRLRLRSDFAALIALN